MTTHSEQHRLRSFVGGEVPPTLYTQLRFQCDDPCQARDRVVEVMEIVAHATQGGWPDDDYWRNVLPEWLMRTFRTYSPEEVRRILSDKSSWTELAWSLGSWLDRMKDRDWQWWSSECDAEAGRLAIYLAIEGYPSSTKSIEHLLIAAGCKPVGDGMETG